MGSDVNESGANTLSAKKKITIAAVIIAAIVVFVLMVIIVINSGYRTAKGTFGYKMTFDNRTYEYITSKQSIDMFQLRDMSKADCDCYVYVAEYDGNQDLSEVLAQVNKADGIKRPDLKDTTVGSGNYPAKFTTWNANGGTMYMYFIDYNGKHLSLSTLYDKRHKGSINKMLKSFEIVE